MLRLAVNPKDGKDRVIMFVKSYKRNWLFRKKLELTPFFGEALDINKIGSTDLAKITISMKIKDLFPCYLGDYNIDKLLANNQFYVIAKHSKKGQEYYCSEKEMYDKKLKRRVQVPVFTKNITKAEFSKSLDSVNSMLTRIRQNTNDKITSHCVFLTIENDLNKENIIFALTNKNSKETRYLKSYDLNGNNSDRVQMCDYMSSALMVKYDEALKIYEDLHTKHKNFLVNLHIRKENENTPAKDFVCKKESIRIGFKLNM